MVSEIEVKQILGCVVRFTVKLCLILMLLVITSVLQADTFFRSFDVEGPECFIGAIELPDGRFAAVRFDEDIEPWMNGLLFFNASGDSIFYTEEIFGWAFCSAADSFLVFVHGYFDWILLWTDFDGNIVDEVTITGISPQDSPNDIVETIDGGFFICGDEFVVKTDASGAYEWHLQTPGYYYQSVAQGSDGTLLAGGYCGFSEYIVNISSDGVIQWDWTSSTVEYFSCAVESAGSGFVMVSVGNRIVKFSASGDSLWSFSSQHSDIRYRGVTVSGTDILACGNSPSESLSVVTRLDTDGFLIWEREYPDCGFLNIEGTSDNGFVLAGACPYPCLEVDTASLLMKINSQGWWGGTGTEPEQPAGDLNLVVYPNPASSNAVLTFNLDTSSNVGLEVYDIAGRCVLEFQEMQCNPGENEFRIDGLGSGIYLCRIISGDFTATQRLVVIR